MNIEQQLHQALLEIEHLKKENAHLRGLLKQKQVEPNKIVEPVKRANHNEQLKEKILQKRVQIFKSLFRGRDDVYAVRWQSKNNKSGYTPACSLEWQPPLCQKPNIKCSQCQVRKLIPLSDETIYRHLSGEITIGLYPLLKDETCWFLAVDFDKRDWQKDIQAFVDTCQQLDVPVSIERSRSGNGGHVWLFFSEPISAKVARQLGHFILSETLSNRYEIGMDSYDRLFPNQDTLPKGGFGNLIALPLQRGPRIQLNSVFVDENFNAYEDQWGYLEKVRKLDLNAIKKILWATSQPKQIIQVKEVKDNDVDKLPLAITIIEKNGLYLNKHEIPSQIMHEILKLSSIKNPEFFKAQARRLSTHSIPKNINCHEETTDFIIIPRGCKEALIKVLEGRGITALFDDQTQLGETITSNFKGNLTPEQQVAVEKLLERPIGILSATTGFGKTVVAASLIAQRKVNTLIIVHRKQLIEQWKERQYGIDMNRLYFAGDSAGAQIISQFVNVQVDKGYANMLGIEGTVSSDKIKGVLLFCGPYDVSKLSNSSSFLINFLFKRVGWAYIGERNWTNSDKVKEASILQHVSGNFPSTFITDGNIGSFDDQGKELADKLKNKGVEVSQIFYSTEEAKLGHEYQFMMNTLQAENTFNKLIEFLDNTSQKQKN